MAALVRAVIDADAWLAMRALSLLDLLLPSPAELFLTQYVARQELCAIQTELEPLIAQGRVHIGTVEMTPTIRKRKKDLLKIRGFHKGETEILLWLDADAPKDPSPVVVTCDANARLILTEYGHRAVDVFGFVVELVLNSCVRRDMAEEKVASWDDGKHGRCRPKDWAGFDATFTARGAR